MIYKYSSHSKFISMIIMGLIASMQQIIVAYMVQMLTNTATQRNFSDLPQILLIAVSGLLIAFLASLIFNRLKTGAI